MTISAERFPLRRFLSLGTALFPSGLIFPLDPLFLNSCFDVIFEFFLSLIYKGKVGKINYLNVFEIYHLKMFESFCDSS